MKHHQKLHTNFNKIKNIILIAIGIVVLSGMIVYVRKYIVRNRAAGNPPVNFVLPASTIAVNMSQDSNFNLNFTVSGQKVTAAEIYVDYDPAYTEYYKEYTAGTGFSEIKDPGKENYFDVPLVEEVTPISATSKRVRLVLVSKFNDPANPAWTTNVTGSLKFRAKQAGTSTITFNKTLTLLAGITSAGEATYFDLPATDIAATINISGTPGTITPTVPVTTVTVPPTGIVTPALTNTPMPTYITTPTPPLTGTVPITTPGLDICKNIGAAPADPNKKYDILFIPDGYTDASKFEADANEAATGFKSANSSVAAISKLNFKMYLNLTKIHDVQQCDPANSINHPCWSKTKAKDTLHECNADGYVILTYTPKVQEDSNKAMEIYNYWGKTSGATWGLGSGESLVFRYNLSAVNIALTRAVAGVWKDATSQVWEQALRNFQ
ncbi:hypothetical protein KAZ66_01225 [Candidatus Woesebacteria bacterium]|nr:hypothetical protein [Candidatus Woesebacteria bacterium]